MGEHRGYGGQFLIQHGDRADHPFGLILMFILIALIVAAIVWFVLRLTSGGGPARPAVVMPVDDALDIVRVRYAKGEIDRREYQRMVGDLGATPDVAAVTDAS